MFYESREVSPKLVDISSSRLHNHDANATASSFLNSINAIPHSLNWILGINGMPAIELRGVGRYKCEWYLKEFLHIAHGSQGTFEISS